MATRTGYVATESAGDVLTAANFNKLPNGVIGYVKVVSNSTVAGTDTTITSVGPTVNTSRLVRVTAYGQIESTAAATATIRLKEGATILADTKIEQANANPSFFYATCILSPSAAAHTYLLTAASNQNCIVKSSTSQPTVLIVEDVGLAF